MSHIIVESEKLRRWCDQIRSNIHCSRESRWRELATALAQSYNQSLFRRIFGLARKTVDQVLEQLKSGDIDIDLSVLAVVNHGAEAEHVIDQLVVASRVASRVVISVQDIQVLEVWTPEGSLFCAEGAK